MGDLPEKLLILIVDTFFLLNQYNSVCCSARSSIDRGTPRYVGEIAQIYVAKSVYPCPRTN